MDAELAARLVRDFEAALYIPSGMDEEPEPYEQRKDHTDACRNAIMRALTAAPEKPKVDVRKVIAAWDKYQDSPGINNLTKALRAAGYEVVE